MNKEQAVTYLKFSGFSDEQIKAIEGAFTCEDCISRQEALKYFEGWKNQIKYYHPYAKNFDIPYEEAIQRIKDIPPVKCVSLEMWIPVSERLPEDSELVLFSTKTDRVFEGRYFADNTYQQWYAFRDECFAWNNVVIAWMPLPTPYKAEGSDKE